MGQLYTIKKLCATDEYAALQNKFYHKSGIFNAVFFIFSDKPINNFYTLFS